MKWQLRWSLHHLYKAIDNFRQRHLKLLLTVHHKNLTTLIGYCNEDQINTGLIYEYMAMGNLRTHHSGSSTKVLSWEDRLRIAIYTAQGLEYLHNGCKPPIVHRDVKSTNILLTEKFQAELGDFGLSRIFPNESSFELSTSLLGIPAGVSTSVAGTPGYLDPEYYESNWLNEKSDVHSFGVVLLKTITGQPGNITSINDPWIEGGFDANTVWKAVEMAMACVSPNSNDRPTLSRVAMELKDCLTELRTRTKDVVSVSDEAQSKDYSVEMISKSMITQLGPEAR
ncbi:Serine/threonine protein kinase, partial [Parasponia andersonii]